MARTGFNPNDYQVSLSRYMGKIEYEYKIVIINEDYPWLNEEQLNDYGKEGWQLIQISGLTYYFVRVKTN